MGAETKKRKPVSKKACGKKGLRWAGLRVYHGPMTTTVNMDVARVFDFFSMPRLGRRYLTDYTIVTQDAMGGVWSAQFAAFDGMGGADDFATALAQASVWPILPGDNDNVVTIHCEYVEITDTYNVVFGEHVLPLSTFSWSYLGKTF